MALNEMNMLGMNADTNSLSISKKDNTNVRCLTDGSFLKGHSLYSWNVNKDPRSISVNDACP
jgi:hypothetical protein